MPAKKKTKKTTTSKAKTKKKVTKKATKVKTAKRKTTKKKAAPKKKTTTKKKTTRKKSEVSHTVDLKASKTIVSLQAQSAHSRIQSVQPIQAEILEEDIKASGFSFKKALHQVRKMTVKPINESDIRTRKQELIDEEDQTPHEPSPYVLDLKQNRSVVNTCSIPKKIQKQVVKKDSTQDIISYLFAEDTSSPDLLKRKEKVASYKKQNFVLERAHDLRKAKHRAKHAWYQDRPLVPGVKNLRLVSDVPQAKVKKQGRPVAVRRLQIKPPVLWLRTAYSFIVLLLLITLPLGFLSLKGYVQKAEEEVLGATNVAVQQLEEAKLNVEQFDFISASTEFAEAGQSFQAAGKVLEKQIGPVGNFLGFLPIVGTKVKTAKSIIKSGEELSEAATIFSQGAAVFSNQEHFLHDQALTNKLEYLFVRVEESQPHLLAASNALKDVNPEVVPENVRPIVNQLKQTIPTVTYYTQNMQDLTDPLLTFLGHEHFQRYLVLFQNNTELRATGGFMGSIALVDIDRGEIKDIEIPGGGPYDYQGSFYKNYQSPDALQLINARWELQDANWFLDYPTSASIVQEFYEEAGGPTVDGVIAIDTNVLASLLDVIGSVKVAGYEEEFTAENFRVLLQDYAEFDYDKEENAPKKIIADLAPVILEEVKNFDKERYLDLAQAFTDLLEEKHILLHHNDEKILQTFEQFNWAGKALNTQTDYLSVVHTNLAGGKTDGAINDNFDLHIQVNEKGEMVHTLTITREHTAQPGKVAAENVADLIGRRNVDYLRVYVPFGSELISASGFKKPAQSFFDEVNPDWEIHESLEGIKQSKVIDSESQTEMYIESGKTVFANWIQVDPQTTAEVKLVYTIPASYMKAFALPEREDSWTDWLSGKTVSDAGSLKAYQLYWQKQPGAWDPELNVSIDYPITWQIMAKVPVSYTNTTGNFTANSLQNGDSFWSFLFSN